MGKIKQSLSGIRTAIHHQIFDITQQISGNFIINLEHARIDNPHIQPSFNGVEQEDRVNGFAYQVVSAKRERHIAHPPAGFGMRQVLLDPAHRFNEVNCVVVMLFHPGSDRQDIWVENDIFSREMYLFSQQFVGARANFNAPFVIVSLTFFVESHHDNCGSITLDFQGMFKELLLSFFQTD